MTTFSMKRSTNYKSVLESFEDNGFTNIKLEKIEDLITGILTEEGEVEEVSVGGDFDYSPDNWVDADTEVIIRYHVFPNKEAESAQDTNKEDVSDKVLTINNCEDFANILSNKAEIDESYSSFAKKYEGRTIEFDGRVDYLVKHENYNTRYDILVSSGDYNQDNQIGPIFKFENVNAYDLDLNTLYLESQIEVGKNVRIVAKVEQFDNNTGLFFLDPVSVTSR